MMQFHSKFSFLLLLCLMHICIEAKGTEHDLSLIHIYGGDAMSTINPDDIAQITLLKGASAAALYGAVAANGAIMITTKSAQRCV